MLATGFVSQRQGVTGGIQLSIPRRLLGCNAYFPHYRVHLTSHGTIIPQLWDGAVGVSQQTTERTGQFTNRRTQQPVQWPNPAQLQAACSAYLLAAQSKQQLLHQTMLEAHTWAAALYQHMQTNWPAWSASLQDDTEYVAEYLLGLIKCLIEATYAAAEGMYGNFRASDICRQVATDLSSAADAAVSSAGVIAQAAQHQLSEAWRWPYPPPLQQLLNAQSNEQVSSRETVKQLTRSMGLLPAAGLSADSPARRGRSWLRRKQGYTTATVSSSHSIPVDGSSIEWRLQLRGSNAIHNDNHMLPVALLTGLQAVMLQVKASASSAGQQMHLLVVQPLQHAGFIKEGGNGPTPAGAIAAAVVLMAINICEGMRRQAQQDKKLLLQQTQLQLKEESLAAQHVRFRRALGGASNQAGQAGGAPAPAGGGSSRRRAAAPGDVDAWEETLPPTNPFVPSSSSQSGAAGPQYAMPPALDADAAKAFRRFMAGARAIDVPMWDSHMVADLPKVSLEELEKQTEKIRAAASKEERAAIEDADMRCKLVEDQLAELSDAPLGRAARQVWRQEQQQKKAQQQLQQEQQQEQAGRQPAPNAADESQTAADSNPFAVSREARAQWDAEDHLYTEPKQGLGKQQQGGGKGIWGFGFGGKQQQQAKQEDVHQQDGMAVRRRFADDVSPAADGAAADLDNNNSSSGSVKCDGSSVFGNVLPANRNSSIQQLQPHSNSDTASHSRAGVVAAGHSNAGDPAEGTAEWATKMRQEMLTSGADRCARRQQIMLQQQQQQLDALAAVPTGSSSVSDPAVGTARDNVAAVAAQRKASSTAASPGAFKSATPVASGRQAFGLSTYQLQRPQWPGQGESAHSLTGSVAMVDGSDSSNSSSARNYLAQAEHEQYEQLATSRLACVVSARDARDINASAVSPAAGDMQSMQDTAAANAETAAQANAANTSANDAASNDVHIQQDKPEGEEKGEFNPFAVDKSAILDDETAFMLGKEVNNEPLRIKLRS